MLNYKGSLLAAAAMYCALQACRPAAAGGSVWSTALAKHRRDSAHGGAAAASPFSLQRYRAVLRDELQSGTGAEEENLL